MIVFFAVIGVLAFIGIVVGLLLFVMDLPAQDERLRVEREALEAAWRIHQHTRQAIGDMLDAARQQRDDRPDRAS